MVEGFVYITVGMLATEAALGTGGRTTDVKGAFREIGSAPFGIIALMIVGAGLFGYALWRIVSSVTDAERRHDIPTSIIMRSADFIEGIVYASFGLWVLRYLTRDHVDATDQTSYFTNRLMHLPAGRWLVVIAGALVLAYAAYQYYSALHRKYLERLDLSGARRDRRWIERLGGFGVAARATVFAMIGMMIVRAGLIIDPMQAGGIEKALDVIANQQAGSIMFTIVAAGLIAYGILQIVTARYRVMRAMG
jgi:TRAP-type C4-dicarboxylate transport system permease small subunit